MLHFVRGVDSQNVNNADIWVEGVGCLQNIHTLDIGGLGESGPKAQTKIKY